MSAIWFMFEGRMEQTGFPALLAPVCSGRSVRVNWSNRYQGRDTLINKLPKLVRVVSRLREEGR